MELERRRPVQSDGRAEPWLPLIARLGEAKRSAASVGQGEGARAAAVHVVRESYRVNAMRAVSPVVRQPKVHPVLVRRLGEVVIEDGAGRRTGGSRGSASRPTGECTVTADGLRPPRGDAGGEVECDSRHGTEWW